MSEDAVASIQAVEILRLRGLLAEFIAERDRLIEESDRLHYRVLALEAEIAVMRGTLARPDTADDGPVTLIEGTPNAPR
jgi:putative hemolysin